MLRADEKIHQTHKYVLTERKQKERIRPEKSVFFVLFRKRAQKYQCVSGQKREKKLVIAQRKENTYTTNEDKTTTIFYVFSVGLSFTLSVRNGRLSELCFQKIIYSCARGTLYSSLHTTRKIRVSRWSSGKDYADHCFGFSIGTENNNGNNVTFHGGHNAHKTTQNSIQCFERHIKWRKQKKEWRN